ncbi:Winged helix-turn-helix DNA-binding [uncultured Caudovirales phage]|uniref:Winged helix-turn-helix DNA-binding n=1 Tax=uncultured Caudovirales phage TaxID=2100421 RepID=A0A6J5S7Q0_9CAUD|nr:Winged helix-turn-helix DNA-binding [uncultured Caudovirales phage]CAB4186317.1 Winged helix-turn-helix DNA-binding [uncultured Caudovirales phage]CAB4204453.1 Winged helix-turn-helix DNA-binding [uncultured Caudovirales phage]
MSDYMTKARITDPTTSHIAAHKSKNLNRKHQAQIMDILSNKGHHTIYHLAEATGLDVHQVARRMKELEAKGLAMVVVGIDNKPETMFNSKGRPCRVWVRANNTNPQ